MAGATLGVAGCSRNTAPGTQAGQLQSAPPGGAARAAEPALQEDPALAYPAGQALALRLRKELDSNGIIYPSLRRAGGTCLVAFRPDLVLNLRQGGLWRLEWQGSPSPTMTRQVR